MQDKIYKSLAKKGFYKLALQKKNYKFLKNFIQSHTNVELKTKKIKLEKIHNLLPPSELNTFRLKLFKIINKNKKFKNNIYESSKSEIECSVGNENCSSDANLSIQYPNDKSSLLSMHTDFFSGESIFQINLWIPFVNVKKTQSMFIINPEDSIKILKEIKFNKKLNFNNIDKKYKSKMKWVDLNEGEAILFSPNCLHGNVVNREKNSRWSINIRYKNLYSPYSKYKNEKKIGTFYKPVNLSSITKFNLKYNFYDIC